MEILGIGEPTVRVGLPVLYINDKGTECPAIVTAVLPATAIAPPATVPSKYGNADLTVFSTNPGATSYFANIAYGTGKGSYHFFK
jgi:hypothetical protein